MDSGSSNRTNARTARVPYQINFNPNCTCLAVVDGLVIAPAVPDGPDGVNLKPGQTAAVLIKATEVMILRV